MRKIRTALGQSVVLMSVALLAAVPMAAAQEIPHASKPAPVQPAPPSIATVHDYLIGTWQSDGDTRFTRELDGDGRALDRMLGQDDDTVMGRWSVFAGSAPPAKFAAMKFDARAVYLEIDRDGDTLLFALLQVSRADLRMIFLQQNQELGFSRLK